MGQVNLSIDDELMTWLDSAAAARGTRRTTAATELLREVKDGQLIRAEVAATLDTRTLPELTHELRDMVTVWKRLGTQIERRDRQLNRAINILDADGALRKTAIENAMQCMADYAGHMGNSAQRAIDAMPAQLAHALEDDVRLTRFETAMAELRDQVRRLEEAPTYQIRVGGEGWSPFGVGVVVMCFLLFAVALMPLLASAFPRTVGAPYADALLHHDDRLFLELVKRRGLVVRPADPEAPDSDAERPRAAAAAERKPPRP